MSVKREIVGDTETTGFGENDRIIEFAAVELIDKLPTGKEFYRLINPGIKIDWQSTKIHGITDAMVHGSSGFDSIIDPLLDFIGDDPLIFHNAPFDMRMINAEMDRAWRPLMDNPVIDTIPMAKERYPGSPFALASLCKRFKIDRRGAHSALADARMLARVYLELCGGRQRSMVISDPRTVPYATPQRAHRIQRPHAPTLDEMVSHAAFVATIPKAIWGKGEPERRARSVAKCVAGRA